MSQDIINKLIDGNDQLHDAAELLYENEDITIEQKGDIGKMINDALVCIDRAKARLGEL